MPTLFRVLELLEVGKPDFCHSLSVAFEQDFMLCGRSKVDIKRIEVARDESTSGASR